MPLNKKGKKIMSAMKEQYGKERGEEVFYATKNKGKIKGVEKAAMGKAVRPRAAQFGRDMGISTAEAKGLINEGRRRKDGGSATLKSNMNRMRGFAPGGSVAKTEKKRKKKTRFSVEEMERLATKDAEIGTEMEDITPDLNVPTRSVDDRTGKPIMRRKFSKEVEEYMEGEGKKKERKAAMGTFMDADDNPSAARGAGAAIRGTKFSGVY